MESGCWRFPTEYNSLTWVATRVIWNAANELIPAELFGPVKILTKNSSTIKAKNIKQIAFKMKLNIGFEKEYKKRHVEIWTELTQELFKADILITLSI